MQEKQQKIKDGHRDRCNELAKPKPGCKISFNEIVENPRYKMAGIAAAKNKSCTSQEIFNSIPSFDENYNSSNYRKQKVNNVKS